MTSFNTSEQKPTYEDLLKENKSLKKKLNAKTEIIESALLEAIPDAFFLLDKDYYFLKYSAPKNFDTYVPPEVFLGKNIRDIFDNELGSKFISCIENLLKTKITQTLKYELFELGKTNYYEARLALTENEQIVAIVRDVTDVYKSQEKLKEREELYSTIVNQSNASITLTDLNTGKFIEFNEEAYLSLGYTREEFENLSVMDIEANYNKEELIKRFTFFKEKRKHAFETKIKCKDGKIKYVSMIVQVVNIRGKEYLSAISNDITERKKAELTIHRNEEKFSKIFQVSPNMIVLSLLKNGKIIDVNDKFTSMTQYTKEEVIGKTTLELNLWTNPLARQTYASLLQKNGHVKDFEIKLTTKSGEQLITLASAELIQIDGEPHILGIVSDITEQKQLQIKLDNERLRLKTVIETIPDLIFLKDLDGFYLGCNHKFEKFFGAKEIDLIGKTDFDYVPKELAEFFRKNDKKALELNKPTTNLEWITYADDGHQELVQTIKTPLYDTNNNLMGILGISRDVTDIYQAQEKLKEREELYSTIVNQANDSIALIDPSTGKFVEFNETTCSSLGYTREEFEKMTVLDIEDKFSSEELKKDFYDTKERKSEVFESRHVCKDRTVKNVRIGIKTITIKGKDYLASIWSDITEIKNISKQFEEQKNFLELLINAIPNQIFWKNKDLVYQGCNKVFADIVGIGSPYNIIGMTDYDFPEHSISARFCRKSDLELIETGKELLNIEEKYFNSKGEEGFVLTSKVPIKDINQNIVGILGISVDITEREESRKKLTDSEIRLKDAQHLAKVGYWDLNLLNNELIWSDEIYNIFEIDKGSFEASYEGFLNAIHPDDHDFVNKAYTNSLKNKLPYDIIHRLLMKDGRVKYVNEKCRNEYDENGNPLRSLGTVQDITERVKIEQEIKELNQTLEKKVRERTDQFESANKGLESFAYSVSHDLRAPLRHIDGFTRLLKKYVTQNTNETDRFFEKIFESINKMSRMIDELLKFSRLGRKTLEKTDIDLNELIKKVINQYKIETDGRKLEYKIGKLPIVQGDYTLLQVVFENLISNAIKFTSKKEYAVIEIGTLDDGSIYIKDNGAGFDMEYKDKLFGVFQRLHTESEFEGTGIGLANVKQIIEKHGGSIKAESEIDKGATFYISLDCK